MNCLLFDWGTWTFQQTARTTPRLRVPELRVLALGKDRACAMSFSRLRRCREVRGWREMRGLHRSPLVHACSSLDALEVQKQRKRQAAQELLAQTFFKKTAADGTSAADLAKKAKAASTPRPVKGSRTVEVIKMKASARVGATHSHQYNTDGRVTHLSRKRHVCICTCASLWKLGYQINPCSWIRWGHFGSGLWNWTVGRALDKIADTGKILNVNNRVAEDDGEMIDCLLLSDNAALALVQTLRYHWRRGADSQWPAAGCGVRECG
ncbi:hypothetical protein BC938DRAFT_479356 [Jimgerdemannia flammicorona]|uniref:ZFAND1-like ubiquitin-like domain-containing protein n=1 Tax=Jimgerdemannia flammicorona TaxID=994334 RepID=A0A433QY34_9FUNG|nr:hypothetical protein BC938DRAFT_479356 [Jimgerdemannia flammicorona]